MLNRQVFTRSLPRIGTDFMTLRIVMRIVHLHSDKVLLRLLHCSGLLVLSLFLSSCSTNNDNSYTTATTVVAPPPRQVLRVVPRPQQFLNLESERVGVETSVPAVKILFPANGATIIGAAVPVSISLNDNSKSQAARADLIALALDNEPYIASHPNSLSPHATPVLGPIELRNVAPGSHLLRAFVLQPSLETYKNRDAFQMITFMVAGNGDEPKPPIGDHSIAERGAVPTRSARQPQMKGIKGTRSLSLSVPRQPATVGLAVDPSKPLLTFALPNGMKLTPEAPLVIDFYLSNAKLKGDGGEYRVRYIIDDDDPQWIDKWEPVWLAGWIAGKHTVRLELIGPDGWPFLNGGYNIITREISLG